MSQEIKIGVKADVSSAKDGVEDIGKSVDRLAGVLQKLDGVTDRLADSFAKVGDAAKDVEKLTSALDGVKKAGEAAQGAAGGVASGGQAIPKKGAPPLPSKPNAAAKSTDFHGPLDPRQLAKFTQELSKHQGRAIAGDDAETAFRNWVALRGADTKLGEKLRGYDGLGDALKGIAGGYARKTDASYAQHRVMSEVLEGTSEAMPLPGGGGGFLHAARRIRHPNIGSAAFTFGAGALAMAGIGGIMGALSSGVSSASEEGNAVDTLKRRLGDLGISFDELQKAVNSTVSGLGITSVEASKLAGIFTGITGKVDRDKENVFGELQTAGGFARSFGIDPGESVQAFAQLRHAGAVGEDDKSNRHLAALIADAISKSGYAGKADDVLKAVADFSQQVASSSLSRPNTEGFLSAMAGMSGSGTIGLDPAKAASLLEQANANIQRGGAFGEGGKNFLYAAIAPGKSYEWAEALMSGGAYASPSSVFAEGTAIGEHFYGKGGIYEGQERPTDTTTNFEKARAQLVRLHRGNEKAHGIVDEAGNLFLGPNATFGEKLALWRSHPAALGISQAVLADAGLTLDGIKSPSALNAISQISQAKNTADLGAAYKSAIGRTGLDDEGRKQQQKIVEDWADGKGDFGKLRKDLVRFNADYGQEPTKGTETRDSLADLRNTLTALGDKLLDPLNAIRNTVVGMGKLVGVMPRDGAAPDNPLSTGSASAPTGLVEPEQTAFERWWDRNTDAKFGVGFTWGEDHTLNKLYGKESEKTEFLRTVLGLENHGRVNNEARSRAGAFGAYQFMPETWESLQEQHPEIGDFEHGAKDFEKSSQAAGHFYDVLKKRYDGNRRAMLAGWNASPPMVRDYLNGEKVPKELTDYVRRGEKIFSDNHRAQPRDLPIAIPRDGGAARGFNIPIPEVGKDESRLGMTPLPEDGPRQRPPSQDSQQIVVQQYVSGHVVVQDPRGANLGTAQLVPSSPMPQPPGGVPNF